RRLWFIDQLQPGSPLYNLPVALHIEGPLDTRVLSLCLGEIVRRHESLRTVFAVVGGEGGSDEPVQVIQPAAPFVMPLVDLSDLPESRREPQALLLAGEEAGRPFDLAHDPLLRGVLLRLAGSLEITDHVVVLTMHHIASDGWSMGILVHEVMALYAAFAEGRPSPLPELAVQYADFAVWQSSWLRGEVLEGEIAYWRWQLAGLPPLLSLPTDRPRPAVQSHRGAAIPMRLPAALTRQVEAFARREGATLFMVLLAAFQALLARYSGQHDLAVGSPVAGRNRMETEELIGFFVNTLVLRGDMTSDSSFRALLGRTRETALAAHSHQDLPFERLVQELAPKRSLAWSPLFQVMFVLQNAPVESLEIRGLRFRPMSGAGGIGTLAKFDLTLSLGATPDGLAGGVEYATDLFDFATVERFLGHWAHLLAGATAEPGTLLSKLRLMSEEEERQLVRSGIELPGTRRVVVSAVGAVEDTALGELRRLLRERLPEHMVPAAFVALKALPLTTTGAVDRKALPALEWQHPEAEERQEDWVAPRTPVEEVLAGIWAELLGISAGELVGAADHFFELGGHSLLATRVMSRLRSAFGIEIPLRDLFEAPVLSDLAARIEAAQRTQSAGAVAPAPLRAPVAPITPAPRGGPLPLSFAQQRLWFIDQLEPGSPLYNMPVALGVEGPLDAGVLALCLGEIERRHESLRTVFGVRNGAPVQVILPAAPFVLPLVDLSGLPESRREPQAFVLAGEEAGRPFDLMRGPMLRGVLLRLAEGDHVVALNLHHIASDGWSVGILVREIVALYAALAGDTEGTEGRPSPLPELPVQYADFAVWQHSWLHGEVLENEIAFWRRQLAGLPPLLELPTDRPRPAAQSYRGATRPVHLPAALIQPVEALARREGA
ncbi:MAG TPA: condensation domain-containing protein, partial [Thermoanaerobaculia bacterium]